MAKLGKRDGLKHHCPKGLAGSNPAPGTLRGRADRRVRGPSGPAAERPGAGSTAATARRRTPEGEYDVTYPRTLLVLSAIATSRLATASASSSCTPLTSLPAVRRAPTNLAVTLLVGLVGL